MSEPEPPKVFISYSHESEDHKNRVLELSDRLRVEGIDCWIDQYEAFPEEGWILWSYKQIKNAEFVLAVCSQRYKKSFEGEDDGGRGGALEGNVISTEIYNEFGKNKKKFIPISFSSTDSEYIPFLLKIFSLFQISDEKRYKELFSLLIDEPIVKPPKLGALPKAETQIREVSGNSKIFHIPFPRNQFFIGREDVLHKIEQTLKSDNETALTQAISGLGGIGKTQIAVEFAYRQQNSFQSIFWVDAETTSSLANSISKIADILNFPEAKSQEQEVLLHAMKRWLEGSENWLLILDNLEDVAIYEKFIPKKIKGQVLITTRLGDLGGIKQFPIDTMEEEGVVFLLNRSGIIKQGQTLGDVNPGDIEVARKINREFDGLPVALEQAGAFIEENDISLSSYLEIYKNEGTELSVAQAFTLSLKKTEENCPEAGELIRLCAFLDPDSIPKNIFKEGKKYLSKGFISILESDLKWEELINKACRYSLIKRNKDDQSLRMHRLVQQVIRDGLEDSKYWVEKTIKVLSVAFPDPEELKNWLVCAQLLPSVETLFKEVGGLNLEIPEAGNLFDSAGIYLEKRGLYWEAESYCEIALKVRKSCYGTQHPDIARSLNNLAEQYFYQGRYEEAEPLYQDALKMRKKLLGEEHPDVATSLNNLGIFYAERGKLKDGKHLLKQAFDMRNKLLGFNHPHTKGTLKSLEWVREQIKKKGK